MPGAESKHYVFDSRKARPGSTPILIPCSKCYNCRARHAKDWGTRAALELSEHRHAMFLTLTYAPQYLPQDQAVNTRTFQLFMTRLRNHARRHHDTRIRYLASGEYGGKTGRPHYHALIFGYQFQDLVPLKQSGRNTLYLSQTLQDLWGFGQTNVAPVSQNAARIGSYIGGYAMKKLQQHDSRLDVIDHDTGEVETLQRRSEFITMSLKPGIGFNWLDKYQEDLRKGYLILDGSHRAIPKAFRKRLKATNPTLHKALTDASVQFSLSRPQETEVSMWSRHQLGLDKISSIKRDKEL